VTYAYQDFPLHRNQLTPETRLNIGTYFSHTHRSNNNVLDLDFLGVFKRWVTSKEDMEIMTTNYEVRQGIML
jgi:hypothetical protein